MQDDKDSEAIVYTVVIVVMLGVARSEPTKFTQVINAVSTADKENPTGVDAKALQSMIHGMFNGQNNIAKCFDEGRGVSAIKY